MVNPRGKPALSTYSCLNSLTGVERRSVTGIFTAVRTVTSTCMRGQHAGQRAKNLHEPVIRTGCASAQRTVELRSCHSGLQSGAAVGREQSSGRRAQDHQVARPRDLLRQLLRQRLAAARRRGTIFWHDSIGTNA